MQAWTIRGLLLGVVILGGGFLITPAGADEECDVDASVKQINAIEGHTYTDYQFEVTLQIEEQCAQISYALVIDETLESGEQRKKVFPPTLVLRSSLVTEYQDYKTLNVNTIEGVSVEGMRCAVCL